MTGYGQQPGETVTEWLDRLSEAAFTPADQESEGPEPTDDELYNGPRVEGGIPYGPVSRLKVAEVPE